MPLIARLRPAALIVLSVRLLVEMLGELIQVSGAEAEKVPSFAADDGHDRSVDARDERDERGQEEIAIDTHDVRNRFGEGQRVPEVVEASREDGDAARAVTLELVVEPPRDSAEVVRQRRARVMPQLRAIRLLRLREQRVHTGLRVARRRHRRRIEVEVEANRASLAGAESGELPQAYPRHGPGHRPPVRTINVPILCSPTTHTSSQSATGFARWRSSWRFCAMRVCKRSSTSAAFPGRGATHSSIWPPSPPPWRRQASATCTRSSLAAGGAESRARSASPASARRRSGATRRGWARMSGSRRLRRPWPSRPRASCAPRPFGGAATAG